MIFARKDAISLNCEKRLLSSFGDNIQTGTRCYGKYLDIIEKKRGSNTV
jgi:hypothetical protein